MTLPNFLIIGAMKSGTTALYYYLEQHPQVFMSPVKEPDFFCSGGGGRTNSKAVADIEAYRRLFKDASGQVALGEASHCYLYEAEAVDRIRRHLPEARLIAILRNPVDRAYSHFLHMVRNGTEPLTDFARALREDERGTRREGVFQDYIGRGFYHAQLRRYFDRFHPDQIRVYLYEDLGTAPLATLQDAFGFLGVDDSFVPDVSLKRNVSGQPKSEALDRLLRPGPAAQLVKLYLPPGLRRRLSRVHDTLKTRNLAKPPPVEPWIRRRLVEVYREDVVALQELLRRDLSGWVV